jgi:hypothetical protein
MHAVQMCLIRDMGEAIIGDMSPSDGVTRVPSVSALTTSCYTERKHV